MLTKWKIFGLNSAGGGLQVDQREGHVLTPRGHRVEFAVLIK